MGAPVKDINPVQKEIVLYDHQLDAVDNVFPHLRVGIFGGVGSGKTFGMMLRFVQHLLKFPGTHGIFCARVKDDLKKKNYPEFVESFGEYIRHEDRQALIITLKNGSKVFFVHGWDDVRGVDHMDGYNSSIFLMSQAEDCPERTYRKLVDRNRKKNKGETEWVELFEGNPRGKNWVWDLMCKEADVEERKEEVNGKETGYTIYRKKEFLKSGEKTIEIRSFFVQCQSENYEFVPEGYLETLLTNASERYKARYVYGKFDAYTGMVYDCWNPKVHLIQPRKIEEVDRERYARVLAFDWGHRVPSAAVWALYDRHEDTYLLYREHYQAGLSAEAQALEIKKKTGDEKIDICIADSQIFNVDPATGVTLSLEFQKCWPWPIVAADKRVEEGKEKVYKYLASGKLKAFSDMKNMIKEIENYRYEDDDEVREPKRNLKETPLKKNDHICDAIRYLIATQIFYMRPDCDLSKTNKRVSVPWEYGGHEQILRTEVE